MTNKTIPVLLFLLLILIMVTPARATNPWNLEADRILSREDENIIEAFGNIHLTRLNDYLQADYAKLYTDTNWLYLKGNVRSYWDGDYLQGDEAELDLDNKVGWVKNGQVFMAEEHMYFTGEHLEKTGQHTYTFIQGTVTSCDDEVPPWSIMSSQGKITVDGYARLWHPRFRVKDRSVLYSPYMIVPVKTRRQSGFLIPDIGHGSEYGTNINLPYYQVIDDQRDATLYTNYYSKRGVMLGLEYRHTPGLLNKGLWRADWLSDRDRHDKAESMPSRLSRREKGQDLFRPNRDRYWLRGKYDGHDPQSGWSWKIDLDYVSDHTYLKEFKSGQSGFDNSRDQFLEQFGRDIQDHDRLIRANIISAARNWSNIGLDARMVYSDNLIYKNQNLPSGENPTIQRLPEVNLDLYRTRLGASPFEIQASNQAVYFWREYGTRAARINLHPRISLPLRNALGTVTPRIGWRQAIYMVDEFENEASAVNTKDRFQTRGLYDFNLNSYTELFRIFNLNPLPGPDPDQAGKSSWTRIKHTLKPEINYDFVQNKDQAEYPRFDSLDRINPRDELTYSISNIFTRRKDSLVQAGPDQEPSISSSYLDFFRLKFEQSYDFREARRRQEFKSISRKHPFSDLLTETQVSPSRQVSFRNRTWYSLYENTITEHEHSLILTWPQIMSAWVSLDFLRENVVHKRPNRRPEIFDEKVNILELGSSFDFIRNWQFTFVYRRDLDTGKDLERGVGILYRHQCYSLEFNFKESDYDRKYEIRFNLLNLGSFGG
ncbi:LPS-assembly protein LptD [Desulfonatronovibrio hydrogenovorans]|uniref:LPS-assembly protein LptD n=1 Tax=Desulfonatronovibrio hydrogenovorans TaxID=53245 RepID=UPI00048AFE45|nr:LPS assembly protein LptD [Desulfonatronovibrio hydrogenovorans]